jgi:hypothetical protein
MVALRVGTHRRRDRGSAALHQAPEGIATKGVVVNIFEQPSIGLLADVVSIPGFRLSPE